MGGSDKDKKPTDKEKEEKKDKKEVCFSTIRHILELNSIFIKLSSICLQKRKREKKKSNRVRRNLQYLDGQLSHFIGPPTAHTNSDKPCSATSVSGSGLAREMSNKSSFLCVLVKHSSSSSSSSSDSPSSSSSESEDEVNQDTVQSDLRHHDPSKDLHTAAFCRKQNCSMCFYF